MNREDIIRMAREAGIANSWDLNWQDKIIERFAKLVAEHEREACAEVCKKQADVYAELEQNPTTQSAWAACIDNRDAIRARGHS
jgi:hypothetical protein